MAEKRFPPLAQPASSLPLGLRFYYEYEKYQFKTFSFGDPRQWNNEVSLIILLIKIGSVRARGETIWMIKVRVNFFGGCCL